jgi:hypothetical protein
MPKLGRSWYEHGFERVLATLASCFQRLANQDLLHFEDPMLAANHFVGMLLWIPINEAMFTGNDKPRSQEELDRLADAGARAFLAAYGSARTSEKSPKVTKKIAGKPVTPRPVLLTGGNPQIAKGDGDAPVQAYIAAMPGWKRDVGRRVDAIIARAIPGVRKSVKWNSPLYGVEGYGWFLGIHCFPKYVKVAFFRGASLRPIPPGDSKQKEVRYLDTREDGEFNEAQLAAWVKQASQLPGKQM